MNYGWAEEITIDFEDNKIPTGWTNTNDMAVVSNPVGSSPSNSYCLSTNGKANNSLTSGYIENIVSISVDATRTSNNTTNEVYIDFCPNSSFESDVQTKSVTVDKSSWKTSTLTLTNKASGYVRIRRSGGSSTATKFIDNIVIICEESIVATDLDVKTAPTKVNYKVGETLDLTGLVLDATVGGDHVDVTSDYTASPANGATLNSVGAQTITFTYGGQTTTQTIHVGDLESIALTTTGVKTTYDEGQTFDPENLVVTATYSDGEDTPTTWTEDVDLDDCTFTPSEALSPSDDNVEVSYTWGSTTKTAKIEITVTAGVPYRVSFNAGTGSCATSYIDEASFGVGVTLPTATIGVTGWSFAGWATEATGNTEVAPTLYTAGSPYHPTEDCTLYAVYQLTDCVAGEYKRATSLSDITSAGSVVIVSNSNSKVIDTTFGGSVNAPSETSGKITAPSTAIFTLTGDNSEGYTLTNSTVTIGATSTDNSTSVSNTTSNDLWVVKEHNTSNTFYFENTAKSGLCLEYYDSEWMVYAPKAPSSNAAMSMKVYVPNETTVYNSSPAAIINPTVAFTTAGNKALYVQNEKSYTNAANVTGIAKTPVYTSSDADVATVSDAGVVTALKAGTTTIKATVAAEVGVNTEASASYEVTVKDASNIAGIKAITDASSDVEFTADLTDAVVTYVNGNHAYIQDDSGAIYASCGSSLTAGKKINGAVSGSVKAAYKIDEITAIDLSGATQTDGDIPDAAVITAATLAANKADYEGKLVSIEDATVTSSLANGSASGGKISDDSKVTEINLYAPDSNIEALKDAEGTFNGYISLFNGGLRFNIYEQSQITLTKNAPTAQPLTFASDAVELDEVTPAFDDFTGQAVSGAIGEVSYAMTGDAIGSVNASTGVVTLNGAYGTATITATAAAKEVTVDGVTTPYTETAKSYTVTVRPRYMVTFSVNGVETVLRQATSVSTIAVPTPSDFGDYKFMGWSTSTVAPNDDEPSMEALGATVTPEDNDGKYYAVYAIATGTPLVEHTSTFTIQQSSAPSTPYESDGSSWTWNNVTFSTDAGACINSSNGTVSFTLPTGGKAISLKITKTSNAWAGAAAVVLKDASSNSLKTFSLGTSTSDTYSFTSTYDHAASYILTNSTSKNAWVKDIVFSYTTGGVSYSDYCTSLPTVEVTISDAQYATFCYARELNVEGTGVTAYTASANGEGKAVTLTKISNNIIPANTGVILFAESAGNYAINVSETGKGAIAGNELVGVTTRTQIPETSADKYNYIFSKKNEVIGFYRASGAYLLPNRAYLSTSTKDAAAREFMAIMFDEGETTSLREVRGLKSDVRGEFFNLNGQRVATPVKGNIYIVNGKKVMFK